MNTVSSSPPDAAAKVRDAALALGFAKVGFAPVEPMARGTVALANWLEKGYHGEMAYMANHQELRPNPKALLAEAKTLLVVALAYPKDAGANSAVPALAGFIARYARGEDYHRVLKQKLYALADACATICNRPILARPCVDSAPLLEREAAALGGVGFVAKNTLTIVPGIGSYVLLGELLLDVELTLSAPAEPRCGTCTACLDACPTKAFVSPYVLDARRCISYLTIELRGSIPVNLRSKMGNMVYGCDICQVVCPFNASKKPRAAAPELASKAHLGTADLEHLIRMGSADYRRFVKGTALRRASREQLARNAAVALGNSGNQDAVPVLVWALLHHGKALVRAHAAWGLGQFVGQPAADEALEQALLDDAPEVRDEARLAMGEAKRDLPPPVAQSSPPFLSKGNHGP